VIVWDVKRFRVSHAVLLLDDVLLICQFGVLVFLSLWLCCSYEQDH